MKMNVLAGFKKGLFFVLVFMVSFAHAQIRELDKINKTVEVGSVGKIGKGSAPFIASLSVVQTPKGKPNNYFLVYNNIQSASNSDVKSVPFMATEKELAGLYTIMKKQLSAANGSEKSG